MAPQIQNYAINNADSFVRHHTQENHQDKKERDA